MIVEYPEQDLPRDGATPSHGTHACANVVVLSADPTLIDLLRDSLAGTHRVWRADDATHAADLMVAAGNAVLLVDSSLADHDTRGLVTEVHKQFPDLAIIVAGRRDDEAELAPLVSSGVIFRFLHKPASAERIRNFVEATQRRAHGTELTISPRVMAAHAATITSMTAERPVIAMPKLNLDDPKLRRWSRRSLLLIPLILIGWAIAEWQPWNQLAGEQQQASTSPSGALDDPRVTKLLDAAGLALAQGNLVEPPEQNALELYRAVLARDPGNGVARRGIDSVADELLVQAERALMEQDVTRLASAVDAARSARPDHPRLEFFVSQLERERLLQGQGGNAQLPAVSVVAGRQLDASAAQSLAGRAQGLLLLANERMRSNKLTVGKDSAHAYLIAARELDPANPGVQQGIATLAAQLQGNAEQAIRENRLDDASRWLQSAVELDVNQVQIATLRADLEAARIGNTRADNTQLLLLANQRIAQGRLIEPKGDSARHYLDLLRAADPRFGGLKDTTVLLANNALGQSREFVAAGNADRAEALLRAATDAGAPAAEVSAVTRQIAAMRVVKPAASTVAGPPAPTVLPENLLRRTFFAAPAYPLRARERETEGWVDLEFTVSKDGVTQDVVVKSAEPAGVFDRVALQAVGRWRYEPRMVNGTAVDQRVQTRVRFKLEE
ncbi:MAG: TonB family protein [Steroidobacteraceae bacterium]